MEMDANSKNLEGAGAGGRGEGAPVDGGECPVERSNAGPDQKALSKQVGGAHYRRMEIQPVEFIARNQLGYIEGNVIKYVVRHRDKNGLADLEKAIHYLELLKQIEYNQ